MKKALCIVIIAFLLPACKQVKESEPLDPEQAQKALIEAIAKGDTGAMKRAFSQGADPNVPNEDGILPLTYAIGYFRKKEVVEALLAAGAKTEPAGKQLTPLHLAAFLGDLDIVKTLVEAGAKVDGTGKGHFTPLCQAVVVGHGEIVQFLLEKDANLRVKDNEDMTLLHIVAGIAAPAWRGDRQKARTEIARNLISRGLDSHATDKKGRTPLHYAAQSEQEELSKLFLEKGLSPDAQDNEGLTPMHLAAQNDSYFSIELLVTQRADINMLDKCGRTPLDHAKWKFTKEQLRHHGAVSGEELKEKQEE